MADEADQAEPHTAAFIAEGIYQAQRRARPLPVTGSCHYCGEECHGTFCDVDCANDYNEEQAIRRKQGLA